MTKPPPPPRKTLQKAIVSASQKMVQQCQNPLPGTDTEEWIGDMYYTLRDIEKALDELYATVQQKAV